KGGTCGTPLVSGMDRVEGVGAGDRLRATARGRLWTAGGRELGRRRSAPALRPRDLVFVYDTPAATRCKRLAGPGGAAGGPSRKTLTPPSRRYPFLTGSGTGR